MANVEKMIAETFLEMAQGLESGSYGKRPKIALTGMGSEHGEENAMEAALMAAKDGVDVYYIGSLEAEGVTTVKVADDEEGHKKMEEMLANGEVDGAVTMHFPFPIGVSTVGRVVTPAKGKEMFVANTTGTSSADRIEGMIILHISQQQGGIISLESGKLLFKIFLMIGIVYITHVYGHSQLHFRRIAISCYSFIVLVITRYLTVYFQIAVGIHQLQTCLLDKHILKFLVKLRSHGSIHVLGTIRKFGNCNSLHFAVINRTYRSKSHGDAAGNYHAHQTC